MFECPHVVHTPCILRGHQVGRFFVSVLRNLPFVSNDLLVDIVNIIQRSLVWGSMADSTFSQLLQALLRAVYDIQATSEEGVKLLDDLIGFCHPDLLRKSVQESDIGVQRLVLSLILSLSFFLNIFVSYVIPHAIMRLL